MVSSQQNTYWKEIQFLTVTDNNVLITIIISVVIVVVVVSTRLTCWKDQLLLLPPPLLLQDLQYRIHFRRLTLLLLSVC